MYLHISTYTHIYLHISTYIYMYVHISICIYIYLHTSTYTYIYIQRPADIFNTERVCVYLHISICIYIYLHISTYIYIYLPISTFRDLYPYIYIGRSLDVGTGWRRLIGSPKLQIIFHKKATKYRSLLRNMTYQDKGSYESSPPCISIYLYLHLEIYSRFLYGCR